MKTEKEKNWDNLENDAEVTLVYRDLKEILKNREKAGEAEAIELGYKSGISEGWDKGKKEAIELGDELIEQYFDKPASVFWDKLKGELTKEQSSRELTTK